MGSCLVTKSYGKGWSTGEGQAWYDESYAQSSAVSGYYVEYGDSTVGDSTEGCESIGTAVIKKMQHEATPYISIDYVEEQLKGFDVTKSYTVNGVEVQNISSMGTAAIEAEWYGNTLNIVTKGDGSLTADSNTFVLQVPAKPSMPTGISGYNRTLNGVDNTMEFRPEGNGAWTKVSGSKIQRLASGMYEIRVSATSNSFRSDIATVEVLNSGASIGVNVNKKVDVALAVGSTGVNFSNFEADLRSYIANHPTYSAIKQEELNIMATNAVDTSGKSEFTWLQFDHSNSSSIYNSSNYPYIENVNIATSQSTNAYNSKSYHIASADNGTKLTFYGYGSSGYSDFMLLENDQETKKSFQFAIKEYFAADALYGTGFFFNCNMTHSASYASNSAAYAKKALYMSGYLVVLEYGGKSVTKLCIYQFENLNLYNYHNAVSTASDVKTAMTNAGATVTLLNSLAVSTSGSLKSTDDLRKFRIDVSPTSINVYYKGFDDTSHSVTNITSESAASSFNTSNAGYVAFTNQKYDELPLVLSATLPKRYKGSDFGPMTKYGGHNCSSLTKVELSELSMTMEVVRSLSETLREPKWRNNTDKFLINLNEDPINDFQNVGVTAELLNRLQNDDIYYIGWCGNDNAQMSQEFLNKNNLKGGIININATSYNTYDKQIAEIARLIYNRYYSSSKDTDILTPDSEKEINIVNAEANNTVDEDWPDGKWRIDYYSDFAEQNLVSSQWMSDFACDFDKIGVYKIYYAYLDGDAPIKTITVHSKPEVSITSYTDKDAKTASLTADVFDSDGNSGEEFTYKWAYKDLGTSTSIIATPTEVDLGTAKTAQITGLVNGHMYIVTLEVTDRFGEAVIVTKQISYNETAPATKIPPTAFFTMAESNIITNGSNRNIAITDNSYDPAGAQITSRVYTLYNAAGTSM